MLKQLSVGQIRSGEVTRANGYLVVTMCYYPRGMRKDLIDEFRSDLAPDRELFGEWKEHEAKVGHDQAFVLSRYEDRFSLSAEALQFLKLMSEFSQRTDVYLTCQCTVGERCHREILLLVAEKKFGAPIDRVFHAYPQALKRLL